MALFTERAAAAIRSFPGGYAVLGPAGSSVCVPGRGKKRRKKEEGGEGGKKEVPFASSPAATTERVADELRRLQSLAALVDSTIAACLAEQRQDGLAGNSAAL